MGWHRTPLLRPDLQFCRWRNALFPVCSPNRCICTFFCFSLAVAAVHLHFFVFRWSRRLCTRTFLFLVGRRGRPLPLFLSAGLQRRPISLQTEVCGDTLEQTRWARQLTGQTGAASAIFFGDARARQVSVGDGHQRSTNDCRAPCLGHPPTRGSSSWSTRQTRSC